MSTKKLIATSIAAIVLATSLIAGASLAAAQAASVSAGTGQGTIVYHAHRVPSPDWAPCFATTCDAGTGQGAAMYFVVYNSTGALVADGFADETGTQITGLIIGSTYYIYPTDCNLCHNSTHNVVFDHWSDGSTDRPKAFVVTATPAEIYSMLLEKLKPQAKSICRNSHTSLSRCILQDCRAWVVCNNNVFSSLKL